MSDSPAPYSPTLPTLAVARSLAKRRPGPLVSLYVPLRRRVAQPRQNAVAYQGAVKEAVAQLENAGMSTAEASACGKDLAAVDADRGRREVRAGGIAVFRDRKQLHAYDLVLPPERCVVVAENFALRPLLAAARRNRRYLVLALSTNRVALFEGDGLGITPIHAQGVPSSLEDALGSERSAKELRVSGTQAGARAPRYFSHDSGRDERALDRKRFHLTIGRAVETALADRDEPLVLVATRAHHAGLRAALRHEPLLASGVQISPDHLSTRELHERTWPIVEKAIDAEEAALAGEYERSASRGKALLHVDDVAAAAAAGRVHRLWVTRDERVPGAIDPERGTLVGGRQREDVLDGIVGLVLRHDGDVIVCRRVPSDTVVAAELR